MQTKMSDATKQAIEQSISPQVITTTTRALAARYGDEIATNAVSDALVKTCEWYDPNHQSGASSATYFISIARQLAVNAIRTQTTTELSDTLPGDSLNVHSEELHQVPGWMRRMELVERTLTQLRKMKFDYTYSPTQIAQIKTAERVVKVLVDLLDADDDTDELPLGDKARSQLFGMIGERLNVSPRYIHNAMTWVATAMRTANLDACRALGA